MVSQKHHDKAQFEEPPAGRSEAPAEPLTKSACISLVDLNIPNVSAVAEISEVALH
jgi:hypothetical protein